MGLIFLQFKDGKEPLALDSSVRSPIFWPIVQITKGTRTQRPLLRLPQVAALWGGGIAEDKFFHPRAILLSPSKGSWLTGLQDPGSRILASAVPRSVRKSANTLLSAWPAWRRSWKEGIKPRTQPSSIYFSKES